MNTVKRRYTVDLTVTIAYTQVAETLLHHQQSFSRQARTSINMLMNFREENQNKNVIKRFIKTSESSEIGQ